MQHVDLFVRRAREQAKHAGYSHRRGGLNCIVPDTSPLPFTPRIEDARFLTGAANYSADLNAEHQLHAFMVRSDHAHAAIERIDTAAALAVPGVFAVFTDRDLAPDKLNPLPCNAVFDAVSPLIIPPRRALARGRVRQVGDIFAMVVAERLSTAVEAAELINAEFEPLDAVTDPLAALEDGAPEIWPEAPGNLAFRFQAGNVEDVLASMAEAAHVVDLDLVNNRVSATPIEPRAGLGGYDWENDRYTLSFSGQGLHGIRNELAKVFNLPTERFYLRAPDVGGGFGQKNFIYPEWVLLPWAAKRLGRPIKWVANRAEDFAAATHGRDMRVSARLGLDAEGRFVALEANIVSNMGAYLSSVAPNIPTKSAPTAMGGIYNVPHVFMDVRGVFTNTAPVDAYRGAGKPEANFLMERMIEVAARRLGFDPVDLRRRNVISKFPHRSSLGITIDGGRFGANIEDAVDQIDRAGFEARRAEAQSRGKLRGLGLACFLETARSIPEEGAEVRFLPDGRIELRVGTESNGQGHETTYAQIAADHLGLPLESFVYVQADTDATRMGHGHGGARSMHMGGGALVETMNQVLTKARTVAAELLQTQASTLVFANGTFQTPEGAPSIALIDIAAMARGRALDGGGLDTFAKVEDLPFTFPNGCHAAEVEIDPDTGYLEILRYVTAEDYGRVLNPKLTIGQVRGGIVQGIGQAVAEYAAYDDASGQLIAGTMMDYVLPAAHNLPALEINLEDGLPTKANPLGVKGAGQAGTIAAPQTIMNAILDALAPLGIDHIDMPATSESIWRAIRAVR